MKYNNNISVILVTYHTGDVLFDCIKSCQNFNGIREVIVVNNGNPKEVSEQLDHLDENKVIKLLDGHGNIGFARACNIGALKAKGKYLLFMNPDCFSDDPDYPIKLRNALESNLDYWFATSLILNIDKTVQETCRRRIMTFSNAISQSFNLNKLGFEKINMDISEIEKLPDISELEAFSGALFFSLKDKYLDLGGLSEEYFLHVEDMDLCMKIKKAGGKICFVKNAKIYHMLSTSKTTNKFLEWHKARGFIWYLNKFYPWTNYPILKQIVKLAIWTRYFLKSKKF